MSHLAGNNTADFLFELGTEELPPGSLINLIKSLENSVSNSLSDKKLGFTSIEAFATPRRLALKISDLDLIQPEQTISRKGPSLKAAYDKENNPSKAALGFAKSCGVDFKDLTTIEEKKGAWLYFEAKQPGEESKDLLPVIFGNAISNLPIAKRMKWGASRTEFVRPCHWLVMLLGEEILNCEILGLKAGRSSRGHRFHHNQEVEITTPGEYETSLSNAYVISSFEKRKEIIRQSIIKKAKEINLTASINEELLEEVTALVEWPKAILGTFDDDFLEVPQQALISSMEEHQKYFHITDNDGVIKPYFITISNINSKDETQIVKGNEKVIRARLSDAAFFFETDKQETLDSRLEKLKKVVFQKQLGTIYDKSLRIVELSKFIADMIDEDTELTSQAALLCKSDLVSSMVYEFPELQGLMGYHYALNDGQDKEVAEAIRDHYFPKFSGDSLPSTNIGCCVAIADRIDTIVGIFGINQPPKGSKDPFALRRASLGILRIIVEKQLPIDLKELIGVSVSLYSEQQFKSNVITPVYDYMMERFSQWYQDANVPVEVVNSVKSRDISYPYDFDQRVHAVKEFFSSKNAPALAAANKRVRNIFAKLDEDLEQQTVNEELLVEDAEKALFQEILSISEKIRPLSATKEYSEILKNLSTLRPYTDKFFDDVMVMVDDKNIRSNRLTILNCLRKEFLKVADVSLLSTTN